MAQFNHPELGGMGQWSQGGMVMVGDMFNHGLKQRVDAVCAELAQQIRSQPVFQQPAAASQQQYQGAGSGSSGAEVSMFIPAGGSAAGRWWPDDLGQPAATGAQNNMRYAAFPDKRRLAIDIGGRVTVYDTAEHQISGFSQQQSGDASLTFSSQHGLVRVSDLAIVSPVQVAAPIQSSGSVFRPTPVAESVPPVGQRPATPASPSGEAPEREDIIASIERLAVLRDKGILTDAEFSAKKADLLGRL
ncbi:MAG TPA: SHOCT domain-containing protein [Geminicoccus sp.]|uniref:SHOCT domain-containing protein n=1 Tax=Geminicoccus sp. TaxID=2024832 RepID=UPI002E300CF3|nr:SHOCT domain-containing protein [Geminicoccus sp.]HEX2525197.1 SHOCT domain-containing protein [Geminicoccus sp.]